MTESQRGQHAAQAVTAKEPSVFRRLGAGRTHYPFVRRSKYFMLVSLFVIVVGGIAIGVKGLNLGIDFTGGTSWTVPSATLTVARADAIAVREGAVAPTGVALGTGSHRTIEVESDLTHMTPAKRNRVEGAVEAGLGAAVGKPASVVGLSFVGPTWGSQITDAAIKALIAFFVGILLYISLRFEWKMAVAAFAAVIHDLLVTVGIYAISGFQVTPSTVVAVLTILGYSLYDTIVVFDRIKENVGLLVEPGKMNYSDTVDRSVNQVLARSLNTSIVAIIPILSVLVIGAYVLGATTLKDFGLALTVGLTSGAYSSLFIASPLLARLKEREPSNRHLRARLERREAKAEAVAGASE